MEVLKPDVDPEAFFRSVAAASERVLFLDYDGTLAPFRRERDLAHPYPGVRERLSEILASGGTRLAIVSGRPLADLVPLLGLERLPELWGSHGKERRTESGRVEAEPPSAELALLIERARAWAREKGFAELFERKPYGFALHGRAVDPAEFDRIRRETLDRWADEAARAGLERLEFDGGFEFRPSGAHKGQVLETVVARLKPRAALAYLGDDLTDEDAFRALAGRGLRVLVRPALRPTEADVWLVPPRELLEFLDRWAAAAGAGRRIGGAAPPVGPARTTGN